MRRLVDATVPLQAAVGVKFSASLDNEEIRSDPTLPANLMSYAKLFYVLKLACVVTKSAFDTLRELFAGGSQPLRFGQRLRGSGSVACSSVLAVCIDWPISWHRWLSGGERWPLDGRGNHGDDVQILPEPR
jgi:hypothetical protein